MRTFVHSLRSCLIAFCLLAATGLRGQDNLAAYTDGLVNGFQDWSWNSTRNFNNTYPVHSGTLSIATTITASYGALRFQLPAGINPQLYSEVSFWIHGGSSGGQLLKLYAVSENSGIGSGAYLAPLVKNTWQNYIVPLSYLGVTSNTVLNGIWLQDSKPGAQPVFYVDDVEFLGAPIPATIQISMGNSIQYPACLFSDYLTFEGYLGLNTAAWDSFLDTESTRNALTDIGIKLLRWPGGSWGDIYHENNPPNQGWGSRTTNFINVAKSIGAQAYMIANYGTGTSEEAADWVHLCNIVHNAGFKYWEVGNENYGPWEADINTNHPWAAHDGWTYAQRFGNYIAQMKQVDPDILVGAVVVPGEDAYVYVSGNVFPTKPGSLTPHFGWTPTVLFTLRQMGVRPDFFVLHAYPQWTNPDINPPPHADNDAVLLQSAKQWAADVANIRQMVSDYYGPSGANIPIVCTENNADSGRQGKQSTSLVNGLYLADSVSQTMKTEIRAFLWWDLRNGPDYGDFHPSLYGWRTWGDLGIMYNTGTNEYRYPTYYSLKLMQRFISSAKGVHDVPSSYPLLSSYGVSWEDRRSLLVINKHASNSLVGQITFTNFVPSRYVGIYSYGIPQDDAARTGVGSPDIATNLFTGASTNFTYSFPPYSLTLMEFTKKMLVPRPSLSLVSCTSSQIVFDLAGNANTTFVIESSDDLLNWSPVSTNYALQTFTTLTNAIPAGSTQRFWRAVAEQE